MENDQIWKEKNGKGKKCIILPTQFANLDILENIQMLMRCSTCWQTFPKHLLFLNLNFSSFMLLFFITGDKNE